MRQVFSYFVIVATLLSSLPLTAKTRGDANGDGMVDIDDVNAVINVILHKNTNPTVTPLADIDGNGVADIDDLNIVVNVIVHKDNGNDDSILDEDSKKFVGYWIPKNDDLSYRLLFFDEGSCLAYYPDGTYQNKTKIYHGMWVYDKNLRYLSNSANNETFLVLLISETDLMCIDIKNNNTYTFKRADVNNKEMNFRLLLNGSWTNTEGETLRVNSVSSSWEGNYIIGPMVPELPQSTQWMVYISYYFEIHDFDLNNACWKYDIYRYSIYDNPMWGSTPGFINTYPNAGTMTFFNHYSPGKQKMIMTGKISGTFTKTAEGDTM